MGKRTLVLALTLVVLFAFGQLASAAELWHYLLAGGERQAVDALIDAAARQNPQFRFTDRGIPGNVPEIRRQLGAAFLAGQPPEMFQSTVGYDLKSFVDAGHIEPIDDVWAEVRGDEIFPAGLQAMVKFDGHAWGIPTAMHVISQVYYNKHIFDKYDLKPPTNWEEYKELSRFLRSQGIEPMATAAGTNWVLYNFYDVLLTVMGPEGYLKVGAGEVPFTSDAMREAFRLYGETLAESYMDGWGGLDWTNAAEPFMLGRVAMYQMGDWLHGFLKERGWEPGVDYDFFPAPGTDGYVIIQSDAIAVTKGGADMEGAKAFVKSLASVEGQIAFNTYKGSVAASLEVPSDIYDPLLQKSYRNMESGTVLPNQLFLLPPEMYQEFGAQVERFALNPTEQTMESALRTLEDLRQKLLAEGAFVTWPSF